MNNILNLMLENTYTLPDLKHKFRILKAYLESQVFDSPHTLAPEDSAWLNNLSPEFFKSFNKDNLSEALANLEQQISKLLPLILYLSFEPDKNTIASISSWLRQNLSQQSILEIKFDPDLIGGCAIVKNGVYKDYSLRARIEEQKELILSEFKKYIS